MILSFLAAASTLVVPATGAGAFERELHRLADGVYVAVRPDVVVLDAHDRVVIDLTRSDFVLREEGVAQTIGSFDLVDLRPAALPGHPAAAAPNAADTKASRLHARS